MDVAQKIDWAEQEFTEVRPDIYGATIHTPQLTATLYRYGGGSSWEEHEHPQDQITTVLEGAVDFVVDGGRSGSRRASSPRCPAVRPTRPRARGRCDHPERVHPSRQGRRMPDWLGLEGQRIVVAGGAGTIGSALVTGFADAGANVGVIDLDVSNIDSRAVSATAQADLSDPDAARDSLHSVRGKLGGLDGLVHCVGINDRKPIEDYTGSEWDRIVSVNLTSAFHLATQAAVVMREQRRGRIVFFSSVAGRSGHKLHGPYAATKGAINQLMRVIAHEYAARRRHRQRRGAGLHGHRAHPPYLTDNPDKREAPHRR